ncbi:GNAT family N-acetyltransferase [Undibacterium sp. Ren11W]|uniref:GNAT family N-acetyltransferase n=1 Tax=Undibacterium sp. Ren11W TaxID=3413045 RepID=UPI003BF3A2DB
MIRIVPASTATTPALIQLILQIQCQEFGLTTSLAAQPDLADIEQYYQSAGGGFWLALDQDEVVGTIGLRDIGHQQAALRKLYVKASHRGAQHGVAALLLARLLAAADAAQMQSLYLATTEQFAAACRFYEKNGFTQVTLASLPAAFPRIPQETRFYRRHVV